jgi:hypothetical protein
MEAPTPSQFALKLEKWRQAKIYNSEPAPESLIRSLRSCIKEYGIKEIRKHTNIGETLYRRAQDESLTTSKKAARKLDRKSESIKQSHTPSFAEVVAESAKLPEQTQMNSSPKSITITNANGVSLKIDGYNNAENLVKLFLSNNGSL